MSDTSITGIAAEVSTVDEQIMRFLPFISMAVDFVPGGAVAMPLVSELLQVLDAAAKAVAAGNPGAAIGDILGEVKNHLTPGQPNSPILSAPSADASAQGGA